MAERVTQSTRRVLAQPDANARVTQSTRRVLAIPDANARVTQVTRRVLITGWATVGARVDIIEMQD